MPWDPQEEIALFASRAGPVEEWCGYSIRTAPSKIGFMACAVKGEFVAEGHPMLEPGDYWFEFGVTAEDAVARLKASLVH